MLGSPLEGLQDQQVQRPLQEINARWRSAMLSHDLYNSRSSMVDNLLKNSVPYRSFAYSRCLRPQRSRAKPSVAISRGTAGTSARATSEENQRRAMTAPSR